MTNSWLVAFGLGLGHIKLGISVNDFINELVSTNWPRTKMNIVTPEPSRLFEVGTSIDLIEFGIICHFQAKSDKLFLIDCYDLTKNIFLLKSFSFGEKSVPNLTAINKVLGPSFPVKKVNGGLVGNMKNSNSNSDDYILSLSGVTFLFHDTKPNIAYTINSSETSRNSDLVLKNFYIHNIGLDIEECDTLDEYTMGTDVNSVHDSVLGIIKQTEKKKSNEGFRPIDHLTIVHLRSISNSCTYPSNSNCSYISIHRRCHPCHSVVELDDSFTPMQEKQLHLGTSPQDMMSSLGLPDDVIPIREAPNKFPGGDYVGISDIGCDQRPTPISSGCYCWKYYSLGLDLYFNDTTHKLFRISCFNNLSLHPDFCLHHRSYFYVVNDQGTAADGCNTNQINTNSTSNPKTGLSSESRSSDVGISKKKKKAPQAASRSVDVETLQIPHRFMSDAEMNIIPFYMDWKLSVGILGSWFNSCAVNSNQSTIENMCVHNDPAVHCSPNMSPFLSTKLYPYPEVSGIRHMFMYASMHMCVDVDLYVCLYIAFFFKLM